jgi:hypothetical protein
MQMDRQTRLEQLEHRTGALIINVGFAGYAIDIALFGYYCLLDGLFSIILSNIFVMAAFGTAKFCRNWVAGRERQTAAALQVLAVLSGIPSWLAVKDHPLMTVRAITMTTMVILAIAVIAACPDYRRRFFHKFTAVVAGALIFSASQAEQTEVAVALAGCSVLIGYVLKRFVDKQIFNNLELLEAREELIQLKADEHARIRDATYQREMELARKIQNSIKAPAEASVTGGFTARTYQIPCNDVAGDWLALRQTSSGTVALVADASGKGIQASLVIHAIQSLWAATLDDPDFDAEHWIRQVNRILFNLGQSELHVITLGLVVIRDNQLDYYGCGHPPLVSVSCAAPDGRPEAEAKIRYHMGKGDILGLKKDLWLQSVTIDLPPDGSIDILLGTDGIIDGKLLRKKTLVAEFVDQLAASGAKALVDYDAFDDKTLIWLHRNSQVNVPVREARTG